ncbi:MAG: FUSC family protein, partial [Opitutaceae bacterium]
MNALRSWKKLGEFAEQESLQPDFGRAIRAMVAFMVPLLLAAGGWLPLEVSFVAIAAQNIAMVDVRGAYRLRLALLLAMTAVFGGAASLGALSANNLFVAAIATVLIACCGGLWRHLSADYGMSLAISSTLVFFLALASPAEPHAVSAHGLAALVGGLWGLALQVVNWPFRPQHPLRQTVADTWLAVADLFEAMTTRDAVDHATRQHQINERETTLRSTLDKTYAVLADSRPGPLRTRLEALNLAGARLATRVVVLNTALEPLLSQEEFAGFASALQPALTSLTNTARTVALAVVSRRPSHLATAEVRVRRLTNLLRVLQARTSTATRDGAGGTQLQEILRQIEQLLPDIEQSLRATVDHGEERSAFSLELLDVDTWTLRPLASTLNFSRRVDPALVRFTVRLAVLMTFGVVIFKAYALPHGYWLPFTMIVVLQPDYGSTRQRAAQRVLGTFAGSVVASALLWFHLPFAALAVAMAGTIFTFGYFVKRNYAVAVFFITLFIVLLTEAEHPVTLSFTVERLLSTLAGGALALIAALFFWPVWERDRFPPILAEGLRANREFLQLLMARLISGSRYDDDAIAAKRRAETSNSAIFSSLQRMTGDPKNRREGLEAAATLANGN